MELVAPLHRSTTLLNENYLTHYTNSKPLTSHPNHQHTRFPRSTTKPKPHVTIPATWQLSSAAKPLLWIAEQDAEESEYSDEDSALLSLSEKPDRNMALLDDYELEELDYATDPNHRSGYVAVLGKPNVGKSTLSNQMVGQKLSIVTDKPQTTRHRILGICSGSDYQMILYDTPGVIEKRMHKLDTMMMKNVRSAVINADCVLVLVDACKVPENINEVVEEGVGNQTDSLPPTLLVMNKKDLIKPGEIAKKVEWYEKFTNVDEVIPASAKHGQGVEDVKQWIFSKLPFGPAYYPKDIVSEHPERFFVSEIVREKIFMQYRKEIPYACQDGKALKLLATASRLDIEDFLQKKVFLEVCFQDPKSLVNDLHQNGFKAIWMLDPGIKQEDGYFVYDSGSKTDVWISKADEPLIDGWGTMYPQRGSSFYVATSAK